jgi:hypothetical protein
MSEAKAGDPRRSGAARAIPWVAASLWTVAGALACWRMIGLEPNLVEEGLVIHFAQRIAAGEHLYRDMVFFSGPLPFELLAQLFRSFGEEIFVGRWAMVLLHGLATGASWALARRSGGLFPALFVAALFGVAPIALFPFFSMFYYTPIALYLGVFAVYAALRGTRQAGWAFAAGLLVSAVALCKQTLGLTLALGLFAALAANAPRQGRSVRAASMLLGGALATLVTVLFYVARGELALVWHFLVEVPLALEEQFGSPYMNLWPPGVLGQEIYPHKLIYLSNLYFQQHGIFASPGWLGTLGFQALYGLPLVALAATALLRLVTPLSPALWCNAALLLAMSTNLVPRSDWGHLVYVLPPAFAQAVLLVGAAPWSMRIPAPRLRIAGAALLVAIFYGGVSLSVWVHGQSHRVTWGPRVPLKPVSFAYRTESIPRVIHYLRQRVEPGEAIFVARAEPLLYFATGTTNPTPYGGVLTVLHEEQEQHILAALETVRYVVMSEVDQPFWTYYADELPGVEAYLERHFRLAPYFPIDDASWIVVLERGPDRGETLIDLIEARPDATAWLRHRTGVTEIDSTALPKMAARRNRQPLPMHLSFWGGGIDYDLTIPPNARFQAGVGFRGMVSLDNLHAHPERSRVSISVGRNRNFEEIYSHRIDDSARAGRRWDAVDVDLSAYAGERITLRLELIPERALWDRDYTWWGSPRIARSPESP